MNNIKKICIGCITLAVIVGAWLYINNYGKKSKASEAVATISFSQSQLAGKVGTVVKNGLIITSGGLPISGIDVTFETVGEGLDFDSKSALIAPTGFSQEILEESGIATVRTDGTKRIVRLVYVAKKKTTELPTSVIIPLSFTVIKQADGTTASSVKVVAASTLVVGPNAPSGIFTIKADTASFVVDSKALLATDLACDSICGTNVILKWTDSPNEDGYNIYKDNAATPIKVVAADTTSYIYPWCNDFSSHTYKVIAYNSVGSASTNSPSINCACKKCSVTVLPTPVTHQPVNTADLIVKLRFPDAAEGVQSIKDVKIDVDTSTTLACPSCSQTVTFTRYGNYFISPQLSFPLNATLPYTVVVKQAQTLGRSYKFVFLQKNKLLDCSRGGDSGCGQLTSEIDSRPLLSGDMDGLDSSASGYNVIDNTDLSKEQAAITAQTQVGDLNFDGVIDTKDLGIVGKNYGQKGD